MFYEIMKYNPSYITGQMNLIFRARMLWRDMASWLRAYMVSLYGGVGNAEAVSKRLNMLPVEYGNILRVYFGDQITNQYIALISDYNTTIQKLFIAQINNDTAAVTELTRRLYDNAEARAAFFAKINPFWTEGTLKALLSTYTDLHIEEANTFLTKDHIRNIEIFDRIIALTSIIGDYFSEGLTSFFTYTLNPVKQTFV